MQKRANRLVVAALVVAAGILGGIFVFGEHARAASLAASIDDVSTRLERMTETAGDIASTQQAYVAPGQPDQPWLERSTMLLNAFGTDAATVRPRLRSSDASLALDQVEHRFRDLSELDTRARRDLQQGQNLLAADLIFSEGRDTAAMLIESLRRLNAAEQAGAATQRASIERQQWGILGLVMLVWMAGLAALFPVEATAAPTAPVITHDSPLTINQRSSEAPAAPATDLAAAAELCGLLARTADTASLQDALPQVAAVLDARGLVVWLGAGEELFPALSYGYDERVVAHMGPIPRNAANATAAAWRTGQVRTVAGDVMSHGAIAAPVSGINGCIGVLAAEVLNRREDDPATRAVASMIAAQLACIVSAWPAGSTATADRADSNSLAASGR